MSHYFFLSSFLEPLNLDGLAGFDMASFKETMFSNLSDEDIIAFKCLLRSFDLINFSIFWSGRPISRTLGEVTQENVETLITREQWSDGFEFEQFFKDYLSTYKTSEERISNFSLLMRDFLNFHKKKAGNRFIVNYFSFKQEFRIILAGFRAKILKQDISRVLMDEDSDSSIVLQVLMQKNSLKFVPPLGYGDLGDIFEDYGRLPESLNRELALYEFHKIEELFRDSYFNSDVVLGRSATYMTAFCYYFSDRKTSKQILNDMDRTW